MWIILVLIYGLLKGAREVCKKKSLEKNTVIEVLFFYTLFSFILVLPNIANIESISIENIKSEINNRNLNICL